MQSNITKGTRVAARGDAMIRGEVVNRDIDGYVRIRWDDESETSVTHVTNVRELNTEPDTTTSLAQTLAHGISLRTPRLDLGEHLGISAEIFRRREEALQKHGDRSIEALHFRDPMWTPILIEEVGEASAEIISGDIPRLRDELIDAAAVAVAWINAIDVAASADHNQDGELS